MKKRFYLLEPLDIDGDKNPDGFLVSQYRIDKYGNKIFLKNKYVRYEILKTFNKNTGGAARRRSAKTNAPKMIALTQEQFNALMNSKQPNINEQPRFIINGSNPTFMSSLGNGSGTGFGLGVGASIGDAVGDAAVDGFENMFGMDE